MSREDEEGKEEGVVMLRSLVPEAVSVLGEYADGRIVFVVLCKSALRGVRIEILDKMVRRGGGESVRTVHVGDVAEFSLGRAVAAVPHRVSYSVFADDFDVPLGPYDVRIPTEDPIFIFQQQGGGGGAGRSWAASGDVKDVRAVLHMGGQVDHRRTIRDVTASQAKDVEALAATARQQMLETYFRSWSSSPASRALLASRSNLMIGEDICGPELSCPRQVVLRRCAEEVRMAVQGALRMDGRAGGFCKVDGSVLLVCVEGRGVEDVVRAVDDAVATHIDRNPLAARRVTSLVLVTSRPLLLPSPAPSPDPSAIFAKLENVRKTRLVHSKVVDVRVFCGGMRAGWSVDVLSRFFHCPVIFPPPIAGGVAYFGGATPSLPPSRATGFRAQFVERWRRNGFATYRPSVHAATVHTSGIFSDAFRRVIDLGRTRHTSRSSARPVSPSPSGK